MKVLKLALLLICCMVLWALAMSASAGQFEDEVAQSDSFTMSAISPYMNQEQYDQFKGNKPSANSQSEILEGKVYTFNTKDQVGCHAARIEMNLEEEVCSYNELKPLTSVVIMRHVQNRDYFEKKINFSRLSEKEKIGLKSIASFGLMGVGTMGILYSLPESVSKWDKSRGFKALAGQYADRVAAGPVIDEDDWAINYIGHPISGAIYYTMVRHQGYSALESATFSFCMSTFFWEYGLEAFAEIPSIQDLILTPLIGSFLGEVFFSWSHAIESNKGKLLGSKFLGKTATVLMNPAYALSNKVNSLANFRFIKETDFSLVNKAPIRTTDRDTSYLGMQLKFKF